jgi:hypothetical protein
MGSLALRPGDSLTILKMALSVGFRSFGFPPVCDSSYRAPDYCPGGLSPAECASLKLDALVCKKSADQKHAQLQVFRRVPDLRFRPNSPGLAGLNSG